MTAFDVTDPRGRVLHKQVMQALREAVAVMQTSALAVSMQHHPHHKTSTLWKYIEHSSKERRYDNS
jgi:cobalamin biosynthesis Co2+ chelatase CbiK